ncbi:MAG: hypothetical protein RR710_09285, partial [Oscillospiraceae bacterium]
MRNSEDEKTRKMYAYEYSWNELTFKLFCKKRCPICGGKAKYFYKEHYAGVGYWDAMVAGGGTAKKYLRDPWYRCSQCNKEYSLDELIIQTYRKQ